MQLIQVDINDIKPYKNNPRKNTEAIKYVANSIEQFGFKVPIVIDKNHVIVAGHTRYEAAKRLNMENVPCVMADDLTDEEVKAYRLADNKVAEKSIWDFDLLSVELNEIFDLDMTDFGFNMADDLVLDVDDDDFLKDTEITKEKKAKKIVCPHCGEEFEV